MQENSKTNTVTTRKALQILGISRQTFYNKYRDRLKQVPSSSKSTLFTMESLEVIIKERKEEKSKQVYKWQLTN
mgnify:CR=1 FL=1